MKISSNFDSGNIEFNSVDSSNTFNLSIRKDSNSDFFQWFHFRLQGAKETACKLVLTNAGQTSYSDGWNEYQALASYDRHIWFLSRKYFLEKLNYKKTAICNHFVPFKKCVTEKRT